MPGALILEDGSVIFVGATTELKRGYEVVRTTVTALDGTPYVYDFGSYYKASVPVEFVSSVDAYAINEAWRTGARVAFDEDAVTAGENLFVNGDASDTASLTNQFSQFSRDTTVPYSGMAYFKRGVTAVVGDQLVPIDDLSRMYELTFAYRVNVANSQQIRIGLDCMDAQLNHISTENCARVNGTQTYLYATANSGQTFVDVVPAVAQWSYNTSAVQFNVASDYSDLPNFDTIQCTSINTALSTSYWRASLASGVGSSVLAGTQVAQSIIGASYNYHVITKPVTSAWLTYSGYMYAQNSVHDTTPDASLFRIGTRFVRFYFRNTTGSGDHYFTALDFHRVEAASGVSSLFIANKTAPLAKVHDDAAEYFHGTIELEGF